MSEKAPILLRTQGGFANRIRAIVSAVLWAEDLDRILVVYWPVEPGHMPCRLEDLLVPSSVPRLTEVHAGYISKGHQILSVADMETVIQIYGTNEIRIESYAEFHPDSRTSRGITLYRKLRIQPAIEEKAEKVWKDIHGSSSWTAIHFRGTDHRKCLAISPLEALLEQVKKEDPSTNYLVCSDEEECIRRVQEIVGERAQCPVRIRGRRNPEQQVYGVVDWLLLQACGRILASSGSSFSETASLRSGAALDLFQNSDLKKE